MIYISKQYQYDRDTSILLDNNKAVKLNTKQQMLVNILVNNMNNTISIEELEAQIWSDEKASSSLRTLVYSLRKLLPEFPLQTYSKLGYSLNRQ